MYLACNPVNGVAHYTLRETCGRGDHYGYRDLFDLGADPGEFVVYPGGNAYYVAPEIEDQLEARGIRSGADELDDIFWPFVVPRIRRAVGAFRSRGQTMRPNTPLTHAQSRRIHLQTHLFDRRRVHYLKFGQSDQARIRNTPAVLFRWLLGKSRDEIEQRFMSMEKVLGPRELKTYVFVVFDLQRFFAVEWAARWPQALTPERLDEAFIAELCGLNREKRFWKPSRSPGKGIAGALGRSPDSDPDTGLNSNLDPYLVRYLIMYFDHAFPASKVMPDYLRDFIGRHRQYRPPAKPIAQVLAEAGGVFDVSRQELEAMSVQQLTRLYRRRAHHYHPDRGGDAEKFIALTAAYHALVTAKGAVRPGQHKRRP